MRVIALFVTLLFSIPVADANQQALLRLHWQNLVSQSDTLNYAEKIAQVQSFSNKIQLVNSSSTQINRTSADILSSEQATSAELAFTKWQMLVAMGYQSDQFRLVYLTDSEQQAQVWLAVDEGGIMQLLSTDQVISQTEFNKLLLSKQISVVSVVDPSRILGSRENTRLSTHQHGDTTYL